MHYKHGFVPLFFLFAGVPAFAAGHFSLPPASFLSYHVDNVNELSQEVTFNAVTRKRLAQHFHISELAMTNYIRHNLVLSYLKKNGTYQVACVRGNGNEYWVASHLAKGTPVFASRVTGQPILKLACGNPMVSALPTAVAHQQGIPAQPPQMALLPQQSQSDTASQSDQPETAAAFALLPADDVMLDSFTTDNFVLPASNDALVAPVVKVAGIQQVLGPAKFGAGNLGGLAFGAGAVATIVSLSNHGGSNQPAPNNPVAPVPETSTFFSCGAMLIAGSMLLLLRRKRVGNS